MTSNAFLAAKEDTTPEFRFYVIFASANIIAPIILGDVMMIVSLLYTEFFSMTPSYVSNFSMPIYITMTLSIFLINCGLIDRFQQYQTLMLVILPLNGLGAIILGGGTIFVSLHVMPITAWHYISLVVDWW